MTYTSRNDFPAVLPTEHTAYCWWCGVADPDESRHNGRWQAMCQVCGKSYDRVRVWDPGMIQYFDDQQRLVHGSGWVFPLNARGQLLLFQRIKFPLLLTLPAGHLDAGEAPATAAARELREETGLQVEPQALHQVYDAPIIGDSCIGGADVHYTNAYAYVVPEGSAVTVDVEEGAGWGWYDLDSLTAANTVQPVVHMLADPAVRAALAALVR